MAQNFHTIISYEVQKQGIDVFSRHINAIPHLIEV